MKPPPIPQLRHRSQPHKKVQIRDLAFQIMQLVGELFQRSRTIDISIESREWEILSRILREAGIEMARGTK